jgi:hypothetical protein
MATADLNVRPLARAAAGAPAKPLHAPLFTGDLWDPKAHRRFWLDKASIAIDSWLRSRVFLKLMQYGLRTAITVKRLQHREPRGLAANPVKKRTQRIDHREDRKDLPT